MPVHRGKDSKGPFYQWGGEGKKYHYTSGNKSSRDAAKKKDWAKPTPVWTKWYEPRPPGNRPIGAS